MNDKPAILGSKPIFSERIPFVRPSLPPYESLSPQIAEIFRTGMLTKGKYLRELERRLSEHIGVKHVICVSSCTLGLMLTYQGLGLKGEVIVPSFTFMATVHPLVWNGATPIFVDVDPNTWNIDPERVEEAITERTTAIVAVHNFGNPADVEELEGIALRHGLKLVFDAAHGFGSLYKGKPVGSFGDVEVFSVTPTKLLVAGEGGVVATDDDILAEHIRTGREYGNDGHYGSNFPGLNARMPEFNAILGLKSLEMLEENALCRNRIATTIKKRLGRLPGITFQHVRPGNRSSYKDFCILIDSETFGIDRDELAIALKAENIDTRKYHYPPVHTHKAYDHLPRRSLPITDYISSRILCLPIWSHMDDDIVDRMCSAIERIHRYNDEVRKVLTFGRQES